MRGWVWLGPVAALVTVACGSTSTPGAGAAGSGGEAGRPGASAGSTGEAGEMDPPDTPPADCSASTYEACDCGDGLEGFEECIDHAWACNCDEPVQQGVLKSCLSPCGGDVVGDWSLKEICGPSYAKGNCSHPVYDSLGEPRESGLSFDKGGQVTGNLAYSGTLSTILSDTCDRRQAGTGVDAAACLDLERSLNSQFAGESLESNQCSLVDEGCDCQTKLSIQTEVSSKYTANSKAFSLEIGSSSFQYCVDKDVLSFRTSEDDFTFTYERSRITLPFEAITVGALKDEPIPTRGLELNTGDCKASAKFDTDALTTSCGADRVQARKYGDADTNVFFLRRLTVPKGTTLTIEGDQPAILVAETIDVQGTISFSRKGTDPLGSGSAGSDQAAGGGAHCSAGGLGGAWTDYTPAEGGSSFGSADALDFGGTGGDVVSSFTNGVSAGGHGGGALALLASVSISVSGTIDVNGKPGAVSGSTSKFGTGGGAGGMLVLQAPAVTVAAGAKLQAIGGRGGGADGGAGSSSAHPAGDGLASSSSQQGGGGGGAGRIVILSGGSSKTIAGSALQPSEGECTTVGALALTKR